MVLNLEEYIVIYQLFLKECIFIRIFKASLIHMFTKYILFGTAFKLVQILMILMKLKSVFGCFWMAL